MNRRLYIATDDLGRSKIGIAECITRRQANIRSCGVPSASIIRATQVTVGAREIESLAHGYLSQCAIGREWFGCSAGEAERAVSIQAETLGVVLIWGDADASMRRVNFSIWTDPERRMDLKMMAVKTGRSIQEIIETAIDRELSAFRKAEAKK